MMRYRIESKLNDGMAEAPSYEVEVSELRDLNLAFTIQEELADDHGRPLGIGATMTITRVA